MDTIICSAIILFIISMILTKCMYGAYKYIVILILYSLVMALITYAVRY